MSYKIKISESDRFTGRFKGRVHAELIRCAKASMERNGLSQDDIAERMNVHKSSVSRIMNGESNLTLKTIGDFCHAAEIVPDFFVCSRSEYAHRKTIMSKAAFVFLTEDDGGETSQVSKDSASITGTNGIVEVQPVLAPS